MRSKIEWWTEERMAFYERAAERTDFHRKLAELLESQIEKDEKIIEFGAGLGYVTEILSNDGFSIKGYEISHNAVERARKRKSDMPLFEGDAYSLRESSDVILMVFFGSIRKESDLDPLLSKTKKIIYVLNRHKGNMHSDKRDRRDEVEDLLRNKGVKYRAIDAAMQFNQPLKDINDAKAFFTLSYGNGNIPPLEKNKDGEFPLLFVNNKEITVFVIEKEDT